MPLILLISIQVHAMFEGVEPAVMYQALEDPLYRPYWDEAVMADNTVCRIEGCNSDICYYASETVNCNCRLSVVVSPSWLKNNL